MKGHPDGLDTYYSKYSDCRFFNTGGNHRLHSRLLPKKPYLSNQLSGTTTAARKAKTMTTQAETVYTFIEFEGERPMHSRFEAIKGDKALIERVKAVSPDSNYRAYDADGRRYILKFDQITEI